VEKLKEVGDSSGDKNGEKKPPRKSASPPHRRRRGRSTRHSRPRDAGEQIVEHVIERPTANVQCPMLTQTNYPEWALVMEVNFQTIRVWDVINLGIGDPTDEDEYHDDRLAMSGLLRSVPSELWSTLARKSTVKEAWDAVKILRIGDERARRQRATAPPRVQLHLFQRRRNGQ
jgi:hypothetical protein